MMLRHPITILTLAKSFIRHTFRPLMEAVSPQASALFSFDFDGTLVDWEPHPPLHPGFVQFLSEIKSRGAVWSINTGRTLMHTLEGIAQHGLTPLPDFIMAKEREIYCPGRFNRWHDLGDWNERCRKEHRKFLRSHKGFFKRARKFLETETKAQFIDNGDEPPGIVSSTEEEMQRICEFIDTEAHDDPILSYQRNFVYLRFAHSSYSKGTVLAELGRYLGLAPGHICAAGDNHNDLSMLDPRIASGLICPSNAIDEVRQAVGGAGGVVADKRASFGVLDGLLSYTGIQLA